MSTSSFLNLAKERIVSLPKATPFLPPIGRQLSCSVFLFDLLDAFVLLLQLCKGCRKEYGRVSTSRLPAIRTAHLTLDISIKPFCTIQRNFVPPFSSAQASFSPIQIVPNLFGQTTVNLEQPL